jgi:hypothetical protein
MALIEVSREAARSEIVKRIIDETAVSLQGRKYIRVEGWQSIAVAHNCFAGIEVVRKEADGGYSAVAVVKDATTGHELTRAEGYVGPDEMTWFGGINSKGRTLQKRPDYAIRAMAQTRAISRACRSAFSHVVVLINQQHKTTFATTPAEEMMPEDVVQGEVVSEEMAHDFEAEVQEFNEALRKCDTEAKLDELRNDWLSRIATMPADYAQRIRRDGREWRDMLKEQAA